MGWLWSSTPSEGSSPPVNTQQENMEETHTNVDPTRARAPVKQTLSREEQANQDLEEILKEFQSQMDNERSTRIKSRESGVLSHTSPLPDDISPETLYPTDIHCQSAFDYAFFCQSFGGQFVNVYRYGGFRSCSNHWSDFWLCMRTRNWDKKDRAKAIQEHYRMKAVKWKTGPSSEDIWDVRTEPVKDAFQDSLEELDARIEQWKKANPGVADPWNNQLSSAPKSETQLEPV